MSPFKMSTQTLMKCNRLTRPPTLYSTQSLDLGVWSLKLPYHLAFLRRSQIIKMHGLCLLSGGFSKHGQAVLWNFAMPPIGHFLNDDPSAALYI